MIFTNMPYYINISHTGIGCDNELLQLYANLDNTGPMECTMPTTGTGSWQVQMCSRLRSETVGHLTHCCFQCPEESKALYAAFSAKTKVGICEIGLFRGHIE